MMYGPLRCFATPALLVHFAFSEFAKAYSCMLRVRWVNTPFASGKQACLGFRAFDPYITVYTKIDRTGRITCPAAVIICDHHAQIPPAKISIPIAIRMTPPSMEALPVSFVPTFLPMTSPPMHIT